MEPLAWVMVGVGAFMQSLTGFGFSLVSAPFLLAAYEAPLGLQLNLALSVALNIGLVAVGHRHVDVPSAVRLLVPAVLATVAVGAALRQLDSDFYTLIAGTLCLVGTLVIWSGISAARPHGRVATAAIGAASGAMNVAAGIGGPPVVLFALSAQWKPQVARATLPTFFLGINVVGLVVLGLPSEAPVGVVTGLAIGLIVGQLFVRRYEHVQVRSVQLGLALVGSVLAIARAVG